MKKRLLTALCLLIGPLAFASIVVLFNPTTKQLVQIIPSADTLQYLTRTDALINPVIPTNTWDWLYVTNGYITNWTVDQYLAISNENWLVASNSSYISSENWKSNQLEAAKSIFNDNSNKINLVVSALALEMWRMNNEFRTNAGMAARTKNWVLQSVVTNMQFLSTNQ